MLSIFISSPIFLCEPLITCSAPFSFLFCTDSESRYQNSIFQCHSMLHCALHPGKLEWCKFLSSDFRLVIHSTINSAYSLILFIAFNASGVSCKRLHSQFHFPCINSVFVPVSSISSTSLLHLSRSFLLLYRENHLSKLSLSFLFSALIFSFCCDWARLLFLFYYPFLFLQLLLSLLFASCKLKSCFGIRLRFVINLPLKLPAAVGFFGIPRYSLFSFLYAPSLVQVLVLAPIRLEQRVCRLWCQAWVSLQLLIH